MASDSSAKETAHPCPSQTMEIKSENPTDTSFSVVSKHRKMMAMPALKILADLDHSEKSFDVLMAVMDRCCREPNNQGVFLGCGKDAREHHLAFGNKLIINQIFLFTNLIFFKAFTRWFLGRFAIIFTRKSYVKAFNTFIELNVKILNLFRDKEPNQFTTVMNEYVCLLKELVMISKQSAQDVGSNLSLKLKSFVAQEPIILATDCLLKMDGLEVNSISECSLLQINITKVKATLFCIWEKQI